MILVESTYDPVARRHGSSGAVLVVDLTARAVRVEHLPASVPEQFVGGRGIGLWLLWNAVTPSTAWHAPDNLLVFSAGPLAHVRAFTGSGKASVVTLSPLTGIPIDSSVGGNLGASLAACGFDAMVVRGVCEVDAVLTLDGVRRCVRLVEDRAVPADTHEAAPYVAARHGCAAGSVGSLSLVTAGRASASAAIACLTVSSADPARGTVRHRQAGRGGIGRVFHGKGLRAIVVSAPPSTSARDANADQAAVVSLGRGVAREIRQQDDEQNRVRKVGTTHLVEVMNAYGLMPVRNFQFGSDPAAERIASTAWAGRFEPGAPGACSAGCQLACARRAAGHVVLTGPYRGLDVCIDGPEYSTCAALGSNCGIFDRQWILEANFYCDTYGVDTISFGAVCAFLMECWERGVLNADRTRGLALQWGDGQAQLDLLHLVAQGEGIGAAAGQGTRALQAYFAEQRWADASWLQDVGMQVKGLEYSPYVATESPAQQAGYALANKGPHHDEVWVIFLDMINAPHASVEDVAEWLHYYPMFRTWFGLAGLCRLPWNEVLPADNGRWGDDSPKVPDHVQTYCRLYSSVTGRPLTPEALIEQAERVYTFQRVFNLRMGQGRRADDQPPYRALGPVTAVEYDKSAERYDGQLRSLLGLDPGGLSVAEKLARHRAWRLERFEAVVAAAYRRRGWTPEGVPTTETLARLGLDTPEVLAVVRGGPLKTGAQPTSPPR